MAQYFLQTPPHLEMESAFRRAWVLGLGGDETLATSLLATKLGSDLPTDGFWESVVMWLIEHPQVGAADHGPIVDYLHDQRFVPSVPVPLRRGQPRLVPPRPNLCMTGRTPESLLRAVADWHRRLASMRQPVTSWKPSSISPLVVTVLEGGAKKLFTATELISTTELAEEGTAMAHCVAEYAQLCRSGNSSVWSFTVEDAAGEVERLLTIQVSNCQKEIVQAWGRFNRVADPVELAILSRWGQAGGPTLSAANLSHL